MTKNSYLWIPRDDGLSPERAWSQSALFEPGISVGRVVGSRSWAFVCVCVCVTLNGFSNESGIIYVTYGDDEIRK